MHRRSLTARARIALVALCLGAAATAPLLSPRPAQAATTASVSLLSDGNFEQVPPQSTWTETQSSGGELIDTIDPHSGTWAADLCDIDNCTDGRGNAGDTLIQPFVSPGQVVNAQLSYWYNVATSEPSQNSACNDWLSIGVGIGRTIAPTASKKYCAPTAAQYVNDTVDVTSYLQAHGGQTVDAQVEGFTNDLNPSQFLVDDISLTVTYLLTPSAPLVAAITDCSVGQTTLTWSAPQFPLNGAWPVQSYTVTPYSVSGVAQPTTTVAGNQTSLPVSLQNGMVCYFTVTATNANGTGPAGSPIVPVAAVTAPPTPQSTGFTLNWALQPGSAAATSYTVFVRDGSGPWLTWGSTPSTSSMVFGLPGHSYEYYIEGFSAAGGSGPPSGNGQARVSFPSNVSPAMAVKALYGVDGYGGLHPGSSPPVAQTASWSWQIARGIAVGASGTGGYVLDGWGGVHPFGNAPPVTTNFGWSGWDIARGIALRPDGISGYVLDGWGGVHPFGGAPTVQLSAYWSGWDIARGIALDSTGNGGYVLDGFGGIHQFGDAPSLAPTGYWSGWDIARGIAMRADGLGGYTLDGWGGLHQFGNAPAATAHGYWKGWDIARGLVVAPSGDGGYVLDGLGGFHAFGSLTVDPVTPDYVGSAVMRGIGGA